MVVRRSLVVILLVMFYQVQCNFLIESLIPECPPTIRFLYPQTNYLPAYNYNNHSKIPDYIKKYMKWAPSVEKEERSREFYDSIIRATGFEISNSTKESWVGWISRSNKNRTLTKNYQKQDRISGSSYLSNKCKLALKLKEKSTKFPKDFNFTLQTLSSRVFSEELS